MFKAVESCAKAMRLVAVTALCCLGSVAVAKADIIWTFDNVAFDDAGTLSGTFSINQYGFIGTFDITTTNGNGSSVGRRLPLHAGDQCHHQQPARHTDD